MSIWKVFLSWSWMLAVVVSVGAMGLASYMLHSYALLFGVGIIAIHFSFGVMNANVRDRLIAAMEETSRIQEESIILHLEKIEDAQMLLSLMTDKDHINQQVVNEYERLHGPLPDSFEVETRDKSIH